MTDLVGETIVGRFKIAKLLGEGPHALVYKAYDERRFEYVALKRLRDIYAGNVDLMRQLRQATERVQTLDHSNLVRCWSLEQTRDHAFWLSPCVDGHDLGYWLRKGQQPLRFHHAMLVLRGVAAAVQYLHEQGLLHGAIKPSNVLLQQGGWVMVTDAYVSAWLHARALEERNVDAPWAEAAPSTVLDPAGDIRDLAALVATMLTGQSPESEAGTNLVKLSQNLSVPEYAGQLLMAALDPHNVTGPASVAEFYQALTNRTLGAEYGPEPDLVEVLGATTEAAPKLASLRQAAARLAAFLSDDEEPQALAATTVPAQDAQAEEELLEAADQLLAAFPARHSVEDEDQAASEQPPNHEPPPHDGQTPVPADSPVGVAEDESALAAAERVQYSTSWHHLVQEAREINELIQRAGQELMQEQWDAVLSTCEAILERAPNNAAAKTLTIEAHAARQQATLFVQAQTAVEQGDAETAQRALRDLLELDVTNQRARELLASLGK